MGVKGIGNRVLGWSKNGYQEMLHFEEYTARPRSGSGCESVSVVSVGWRLCVRVFGSLGLGIRSRVTT